MAAATQSVHTYSNGYPLSNGGSEGYNRYSGGHPGYYPTQLLSELPSNHGYPSVQQRPSVELPVAGDRYMETLPDGTHVYQREVLVDRVVKVPRTEVKHTYRYIDFYDAPVVYPRQIEDRRKLTRNVPVPVDVTTTLKYLMPQLKPKYNEGKVICYAPRYIEVAVPVNVVQVDEFYSTMIPGPPSKDVKMPEFTNGVDPKEIFQQFLEVLNKKPRAAASSEDPAQSLSYATEGDRRLYEVQQPPTALLTDSLQNQHVVTNVADYAPEMGNHYINDQVEDLTPAGRVEELPEELLPVETPGIEKEEVPPMDVDVVDDFDEMALNTPAYAEESGDYTDACLEYQADEAEEYNEEAGNYADAAQEYAEEVAEEYDEVMEYNEEVAEENNEEAEKEYNEEVAEEYNEVAEDNAEESAKFATQYNKGNATEVAA